MITTGVSPLHDGFRYGDTEHNHYQQRGYCIFEQFLTCEALADCQLNISRMVDQLHKDRTPEQIVSPHQLGERWIWELATSSKVLDIIERQIGPNIILWTTAVLAKPPHTGKPVPWHQDAPYWNISGPLAGAVWIPLDDVNDENGTMSILPGWHTKGQLERLIQEKEFFSEQIDPAVLPANIDELKVKYQLRAGQMAIHHTMLPHVSGPNRSNRWRRLLILRYMSAEGTAGEREYTDYRTGKPFMRKLFLVRGADVKGYGLKRSPFDD